MCVIKNNRHRLELGNNNVSTGSAIVLDAYKKLWYHKNKEIAKNINSETIHKEKRKSTMPEVERGGCDLIVRF
jgi:predicted kinase